MKQLFIILLIFITVSGCKKHATTYTDSGTLTGLDFRTCVCCGGAFLQNDQTEVYHIESLPGMRDEDFAKLTFPKRINYNWTPDRNCGGIVYIKITSYKFE